MHAWSRWEKCLWKTPDTDHESRAAKPQKDTTDRESRTSKSQKDASVKDEDEDTSIVEEEYQNPGSDDNGKATADAAAGGSDDNVQSAEASQNVYLNYV